MHPLGRMDDIHPQSLLLPDIPQGQRHLWAQMGQGILDHDLIHILCHSKCCNPRGFEIYQLALNGKSHCISRTECSPRRCVETGFTHYADRQEREVTGTELARNNIYGTPPPPFKTALPLTMVLVSPAHLPPAPVQK